MTAGADEKVVLQVFGSIRIYPKGGGAKDAGP